MKIQLPVFLVVLVVIAGCDQSADATGNLGGDGTPGYDTKWSLSEVFREALGEPENGMPYMDSPPNREVQPEPTIVTLGPKDYTNEPVVVGNPGFHFQYDDLLGPVQVIKADDRCGIVRGEVSDLNVITYKVEDSEPLLDLSGVKLVREAYEFQVKEGEVLHGNEELLSVPIVAVAFCPMILVESTNTLFQGDIDDGPGCQVPFLLEGVTYVADLGKNSACGTYDLPDDAEVYLIARYDVETGASYVLVPFFAENGVVWSPCVPMEPQSPKAFEDTLSELLVEVED